MGKRTIVIIASIVAIVGAVVFRLVMNNKTEEEQTTSDKTCFKYSGTKITGYYYNLCGKEVVIPRILGGVEVQSIGESAFENMQITSVTLPDSLLEIEQYAFNKNLIESVVIPEKVTSIGKNAFSNNKISNLEFKSSKIDFGETPFNNNLLDDKNAFIYDMSSGLDTSYIVSYAGKNRDNVKVPNGVKNIGPYAFSDQEIKKITLDKDLVVIGNGAFVGNNFAEITIPGKVESLGDNAFDYNIQRIVVENKGKIDDFSYYGMQTFLEDVLIFDGKTKKTEKELELEKVEEGIIQ